MNRTVNEEGLKLNKQTELPLLFAMSSKEQIPDQLFSELLVSQCQVPNWAGRHAPYPR
jgi:aspartyl aminopeptidase